MSETPARELREVGVYEECMMVPSRFFEALDSYQYDQEWERKALKLAGGRYTSHRWSYWVQMTPVGFEFRDHGFKLHIAPDFEQLTKQVDATLAALIEFNVAFKFVADRELLKFTNSKNFARAASAKFFTVYPSNDVQFRSLALNLAKKLRNFSGPYILTDRRVPRSKCVGYRFGGHRTISVPNGDGGSHMLIPGPDGSLIEDIREPRFFLPQGIDDPFGQVDELPPSSQIVLNSGRYRIISALYFSNCGGVYKAEDTFTGKIVVLKEARRYSGVREGSNAQDALRHEYDVLCALASIGVTPQPIELFEEWESLFLSQEHLEMTSWHNTFVLERYFLGPFVPGLSRIEEFLKAIVPLACMAIDALQKIHDAGFVLGDVSSNNIMVNAELAELRFIDVESALRDGDATVWQGWWNTPGFAKPTRGHDVQITRDDDWYGLAMCFISAVMNFGDLPRLGGMNAIQIVDTLEEFTGLPPLYGNAVVHLLEGNSSDARMCLEAIGAALDAPRRNIYRHGHVIARPQRRTKTPIAAENMSNRELVTRLCTFIEATYRGPASREFWPADPAIYSSNIACIAYGASGIGALLMAQGRSLPASLESYLAGYRPDEKADLGLYTGLAGIAYVDARYRSGALVSQLLATIEESPLRYTSTGIRSGEAGIGIAALSLHSMTGDSTAFKIAVQAADYLMHEAIHTQGGHCAWMLTTRTRHIHYGYLTGIAGIAFFLAQYGIYAGDENAILIARKGIEYVLAHAVTDSRGNLSWGKHEKDGRLLPYAASGSAGIGSILARLGKQLNDEYYTLFAKRLVYSSYHRLSVCVGQFDGLSGISEFMVDLQELAGC